MTTNKRTFFDFEIGQPYQGRTVLLVNIATECGYTPQLEDLENLNQLYDSEKFAIVAVPSNQFLQNPLGDLGTRSWCQANYKTTFTITDQIDSAHSLWRWLEESGPIRWNFEKFLINTHGKVLMRYDSAASIGLIKQHISRIIQK